MLPTHTLPAETWFRVLAFAFAVPPGSISIEERKARAGLLRVSKTFKNLASPLFYAYPHFSTPSTLAEFTDILQASDRAWDSLRRIPYSTPGRWVQALDLSRVSCTTAAERLAVDTMLTQLFPLTPFLSRLVLNSTVRMSRRAMAALTAREGAGLLQVLKGIKWVGAGMTMWSASGEDPLLALVRVSVGLEELEVFGPGLLDDDDDDGAMTPQLTTPPPTPLPPLCLPKLHSLMILSLPKSPLLASLVRSPLPSLRHLMVTPYDGVPSAHTSALIAAHGAALHTLAFHTPKTWPPIRAATPPTLLHTSPHLRALSLTFPLPPLVAPPPAPAKGHPLRVLSLPRPDPTYLYKLEAWLYLGLLQCLEEVHMRDVRWIRAGLSSRAAEAGVQGDMQEWKRRLGRWRVRVVDVSGKEDAL
ncbi:hypothetical protein JB92DRAFT_3081585 [Gautieria morchelliformis]|nr:hypothetical protein JB92DRAFT_3081585 [Gautieria morchelliformis]